VELTPAGAEQLRGALAQATDHLAHAPVDDDVQVDDAAGAGDTVAGREPVAHTQTAAVDSAATAAEPADVHVEHSDRPMGQAATDGHDNADGW
jgi:hypothetical protein